MTLCVWVSYHSCGGLVSGRGVVPWWKVSFLWKILTTRRLTGWLSWRCRQTDILMSWLSNECICRLTGPLTSWFRNKCLVFFLIKLSNNWTRPANYSKPIDWQKLIQTVSQSVSRSVCHSQAVSQLDVRTIASQTPIQSNQYILWISHHASWELRREPCGEWGFRLWFIQT